MAEYSPCISFELANPYPLVAGGPSGVGHRRLGRARVGLEPTSSKRAADSVKAECPRAPIRMNSRILAQPAATHLATPDPVSQAHLERDQWITIANVLVPWVGALAMIVAMVLLNVTLRPGWIEASLFVG